MSKVWTETTGTLSNEAVPIAGDRSVSRTIVSNNSDTVMTLRIGEGKVASAAAGIAIPPGTALDLSGELQTNEDMSLFCAGAAKAYTVYRR